MASLGVGMAALGRPGYINLGHAQDMQAGSDVESVRARCHDVLDAAWAAGVRHFDAARSYGLGERFVGDWLRTHPRRRDLVTLGSKWGYTYVADWRTDVDTHEVKDHSVSTLGRQWPETLEALGGPPDLYLVHSLTPDSPALRDTTLLHGLRDLAATGVRVGFSTSGAHQSAVIRHALELADSPFTAVQSTWNCLDPSAGAALTEVHRRGWHVTVKEGVANGRLTARGTPPAVVTGIAERRSTTPDAVALAHALAQPVDVVLSGAATVQQFHHNHAAASITLDDDELRALAGVAQPASVYWSERSALPWQ